MTISSAKALRIVFAGTPEFAATSLQALIDSPHELVGVYTQPDRPAGRGRKPRPSPVKQLALQHGIPVFQPSTLKSEPAQTELAQLAPDIMVVVAYGLLLPEPVLMIPRYGCLNVHASLLPRWRGAAPIQRAILAGDTESGVTIMQMDVGLDTGDMLNRVSCPIGEQTTGGQLHDQLATLGAEALLATLEQLLKDQLKPISQDPQKASYANKLDKAEAWLDWQSSAAQLARQVRAFNPWPVSQLRLGDQVIRVWEAAVLTQDSDSAPGTIIAVDREGIRISCGKGILTLLRIQLPGGKPAQVDAVLNGHPNLFRVGMSLLHTS